VAKLKKKQKKPSNPMAWVLAAVLIILIGPPIVGAIVELTKSDTKREVPAPVPAQVEPTDAEKRGFEKRMMKIISTHPKPVVSKRLLDLMKSGDVHPGFSFGPTKVLGEMAKAFYDTSGGVPGRMRFTFHVHTFFAKKTSDGDRQMAVYHEALHVVEMVDEPGDRHLFDARRMPQGVEEVSAAFESEARAYWLQCEFGVEHNLVASANDRFCLTYQQRGRNQLYIRQVLAGLLPKRLPEIYGGYESELSDWANDPSRFHRR